MGNEFEKTIAGVTGGGLHSEKIDVIQVNLGLYCNQQCTHCHLNSSPGRTEVMDLATMEKVLEIVKRARPDLVDITGGAPELNPNFRDFAHMVTGKGVDIQVRTNLTVFFEDEHDYLPGFYREKGASLVASLPCYLEENVEAQRGEKSYERSIEAIKLLNREGYGRDESLVLNLVYNPGGPFLPPPQKNLEEDYRRELRERFDIEFTNLLTITNMPIGRFLSNLLESKKYEKYRNLLRGSFNEDTLNGVMCRHQVSIAWDGRIYDCDFNLALGLMVDHGAPDHIKNFDFEKLSRRRIVTGEHCFGCTAGAGSSCFGALI